MKRHLARGLEVLWRAVVNYSGDDCTLLAAAIAFYSLLSLAPALYLFAALLGPFFAAEDVSRRIVEHVATFLPAEALPTLQNVQQSLEVSGGLIVIALPGLLWIATHAFSALQQALNIAFGRRSGPVAYWQGRLKGVAALVVSALLVGGLLVLNSLLPWLGTLAAVLGYPVAADPLSGLARRVVSLGLVFLVIFLAYRLLPSRRVPRRPAAAGALLALVLWEASRAVFSALVRHSPAFGLVTGTLAGVLGFLFWIYTGVAVILFGAEVAAVLNGDRETQEATNISTA